MPETIPLPNFAHSSEVALFDEVEAFILGQRECLDDPETVPALLKRHRELGQLILKASDLITVCEREAAEKKAWVKDLWHVTLTGGPNNDAPPPGRTERERRAYARISYRRDAQTISAESKLWYWQQRKEYLQHLRDHIKSDLRRIEMRLMLTRKK